MKKVLVTGGSGFIGSAYVQGLLRSGCHVRVLDNNSRGSLRRLSAVIDDIEFIEGDVRDAEVVAAACKGMSSVSHLAYINGTEFFYSMPELILEVGVKGILNVIDGCLKHDVSELVLASSSEVYQQAPILPAPEQVPMVVPDPHNPRFSYGGGKIISELLVLNYGRKFFERTLVFRPHNVYGPDMGWEHVLPQFILRMKSLVEQSAGEDFDFPIQGTGLETRSFIYIDDFVDGLILMLEKGESQNIYNIGTMDEVTIRDLATEVGKYFNVPANIIQSKPPRGETIRRCPDISKLRALGFEPRIGLREGVGVSADWYCANAHLHPDPEQL
jgi:nucleoside-diphosphate-sugar epimerase